MITFVGYSRKGKAKEMEIRWMIAGSWGLGQRLTTKRHQETFWGNGSVLYLDWNGYTTDKFHRTVHFPEVLYLNKPKPTTNPMQPHEDLSCFSNQSVNSLIECGVIPAQRGKVTYARTHALESGKSGFKSHLFHLLACCPWQITSSFWACFLIWKMGVSNNRTYIIGTEWA